ncbi:MAG TPA: SRPBCC domain-containing protein [Alphaproteobacteria bacterium]
MKFDGEITVPGRREAVFDKVQDARTFAWCVDGVGDLTEVDGAHYTATLETKIAYLRFRFKVAVEVLRVERPNLIEARIEGTPIGVVGRLSATSTTTLEDLGGETRIRYAVEVALTGKLGSMGQPVLRSKAKDMEKSFAANLRRVLTAPAIEAAPTEATT